MNTTGTSKVLQQLVDRIETRAAIGELNIGQDQARLLVLRQRDRIRMGARDADDVMAKILDEAFEIHRDERLVLDDEHVGRDLGGHLAAGGIGQVADSR